MTLEILTFKQFCKLTSERSDSDTLLISSPSLLIATDSPRSVSKMSFTPSKGCKVRNSTILRSV